MAPPRSSFAFNFGDLRVPDAIWDRLTPIPELGCWLWLGASTKGHGHLRYAGRHIKIHRLTWRLLRGRWPRRMLDHKCRNRCCANPAHLRDVTNRVNTLAGEGPTAQRRRARIARGGYVR